MRKKKIKLLLFSFFLLNISIFGNSLTGFCFSAAVNLNHVKRHIRPIMAPRDKVFARESMNCLELAISPVREKLFRNWIRKRYQIVNEYSVDKESKQMQTITNQQFSKKHCQMKMTRMLKGKKEKSNFSFGKKSNLSKSEETTDGELVSSLMLMDGRKGSIEINKQEVSILCHFKSSNRYLLDINIKGEKASLMTSVEIVQNQKINIGDIVDKINKKSRSINSKSVGIGLEKTKGISTYTYFISIN